MRAFDFRNPAFNPNHLKYGRKEKPAVSAFSCLKESFSQEFLDLMNYITESTDAAAKLSGSERIRLIHHNVKKIRASEKMGVKYMQKWEELVYARDEGREEGLTEGETNHLVRQIRKKLSKGRAPERIAQELEEDLEVIEEICRRITKENEAEG